MNVVNAIDIFFYFVVIFMSILICIKKINIPNTLIKITIQLISKGLSVFMMCYSMIQILKFFNVI